MTAKKRKVGFFNAFSGRLKTIFGVRFRNLLFFLSNFRRFSAPILPGFSKMAVVSHRFRGKITPDLRLNHAAILAKSRHDLGCFVL